MEGFIQLSGLVLVAAAPGRANITRTSDEKLWKTRGDPDFLQWLRQGSLQQEHQVGRISNHEWVLYHTLHQ